MDEPMNDSARTQYTARTPDNRTLTGTASQIAAWLQEQDWDWGEAGPDGAIPWRRVVATRAVIQTGKTIDPAAVEAEDATAFLKAVAALGLITLQEIEESEGADADG